MVKVASPWDFHHGLLGPNRAGVVESGRHTILRGWRSNECAGSNPASGTNSFFRAAQDALSRLLEAGETTRGVYVRVWGKHLIVGREEALGPNGELQNSDRVRLTRLNASTYGLSVTRHTDRWEKTPFSGSMKDMVEVMQSLMQHLLASY